MLNHLTYQGRFVEDPRFGQTNSGTDFANFRLAWSEKYKDRENKCFLECKAFGSAAVFMQKYMNRKGQEILVEGKLNTDEWGEGDQRKSKIVLMVENVHFCGRKESGETQTTAQAAPAQVAVDGELPF